MSDIVERTLKFAYENDKPVTVCYLGKEGISQRRVYVRKIDEGKVTVYCTQKRAIRVFRLDGILSAQIAEEGG